MVWTDKEKTSSFPNTSFTNILKRVRKYYDNIESVDGVNENEDGDDGPNDIWEEQKTNRHVKY